MNWEQSPSLTLARTSDAGLYHHCSHHANSQNINTECMAWVEDWERFTSGRQMVRWVSRIKLGRYRYDSLRLHSPSYFTWSWLHAASLTQLLSPLFLSPQLVLQLTLPSEFGATFTPLSPSFRNYASPSSPTWFAFVASESIVGSNSGTSYSGQSTS